MSLEKMKLLMALFAIALITLPIMYDSLRKTLKKIRIKLWRARKYKLQITVRTNTGSLMVRNRYYPSKSIAILAAWWYGPDPKTSWIKSIQTSIVENNG